MRDVIILGGGVSGLMNAYFLNKKGLSVSIIDKDSNNIQNKTSFGNAGLLSAFSKTPLSHPGIFLETIKLLLKKQSPLYISSFPSIKTLAWSLKFFFNSNTKNTQERMKLFEKYGQESLDIYNFMQKELKLDFDYHQKGFLSVFTNKDKYLKMKKIFSKDVDKVSIVQKDELEKICPIIDIDKIYGAFLLHKNGHLDPNKLLINLKTYLQEQGINFIDNVEIIDIETSNNKISALVSKHKKYQSKNYILASGIDVNIAKKLNTNLMQIPTKGYSITLKTDYKLELPIMLTDKFAIITPRKNDIRITSNLEIGSTNPIIEQKKVDALLSNIREITNNFDILDIQSWCGFRALTPDDKPLLGRDKKYKNLVYSMGLGWLGMTFGGSIGKMVSSLIVEDMDNLDSADIMDFSGLIK